MPAEPDPTELVRYRADTRLLGQDAANLPAEIGRPEVIPPTRARGAIVAFGATMTGVTLLGGIALIAFALITSFAEGADVLRGVLLALGIAMVATHWGWVHVAELTAGGVESRHNREAVQGRERWLETVAPYTRHEVHTEVEEDGSIAIVSIRYVPVSAGRDRFTFTREEEGREVHSGEEPAAAVAERAERLRREAALATERELERYLAAADAYETSQLLAEDERERLAARRAASLALSEQINANLRSPPVDG
jgi:hypothetical protein